MSIAIDKLKSSKSFSIYFLASTISKGIPFLLLPVVSSMISPEGFGKWSLYSSSLLVLTPLIGLMAQFELARVYYKTSKSELSVYYFNSFFISFIAAIVSTILFIVFKKQIQIHWEIPFAYILLIPTIGMLSSIKAIILQHLRFSKQVGSFAIFEVGGHGFIYVFSVAILFFGIKTWSVFVIATLVSNILLAVFGCVLLVREGLFSIKIDLSKMKKVLKVGIPMIPHALGSVVIGVSDRFILEQTTSYELLGIYSMAYTVGMGLQLITMSFNKSWSPFVYEKLVGDKVEAKVELVKKTLRYAFVLFLISLVIAFTGFIYVRYFLDSKFQSGAVVVPWVVLACFFQGIYFCVFPYLVHVGKTYMFSIVTGISAVLNIYFTVKWSKTLGIEGAAAATALSFLVSFLLTFSFSQYYYPMPWLGKWRRNG